MVKVLKMGNVTKRPEMYFKATCPWCNSELAFEYGDMWIEDPKHGIGRIECPVCRTKVFLMTVESVTKVSMEMILKSEYDNATTDTSKRGFEILMAEKLKEDMNDRS